MARGSLATHYQTQHGVAKGGPGQEVNREGKVNEPRTYMMVFPVKAIPRTCPDEGCSGQAATQMSMQVHFWHRPVRDNVVVLEAIIQGDSRPRLIR